VLVAATVPALEDDPVFEGFTISLVGADPMFADVDEVVVPSLAQPPIRIPNSTMRPNGCAERSTIVSPSHNCEKKYRRYPILLQIARQEQDRGALAVHISSDVVVGLRPTFQIFSAFAPRYQKLRPSRAKKIALWIEFQNSSKNRV